MTISTWKSFIAAVTITTVLFCSSCVQRKLTIVTEPSGALVTLNDEEIGTSPVTVGFEWYGDYAVRISKDGYVTLNTHKNLPQPLRDKVGIDLLYDMFSSRVDEYQWEFELAPYQPMPKDELIKSAVDFQKQALVDPNA